MPLHQINRAERIRECSEHAISTSAGLGSPQRLRAPGFQMMACSVYHSIILFLSHCLIYVFVVHSPTCLLNRDFYAGIDALKEGLDWIWGSRELKETLQSDLCVQLFEVASTNEAIASASISSPVNISHKKSCFYGQIFFFFFTFILTFGVKWEFSVSISISISISICLCSENGGAADHKERVDDDKGSDWWPAWQSGQDGQTKAGAHRSVVSSYKGELSEPLFFPLIL